MADLTITSLVKSFGALQVLHGVDLALQSGERRAIIGPNGTGKTTLFHCIGGYHLPTSGRVLLGDHDITHLPMHRRARLGLARTFQVTNLFQSLTVLENVLLAVQAFDPSRFQLFRLQRHYPHVLRRAEELLAQWQLLAKADDPVSGLSYGEQRQLEVILALAGSPSVLLLDEPTAGLAADDRERLTGLIQGLSRSITLLIIEHDVEVAFAVGDQVTVMNLGYMVTTGTPDEVRADARVRELYLGAG